MLAELWAWLWGQVWPNIFASMICTLPALAWHHRRIRRHITRSERDSK